MTVEDTVALLRHRGYRTPTRTFKALKRLHPNVELDVLWAAAGCPTGRNMGLWTQTGGNVIRYCSTRDPRGRRRR